MPLLVLSACYDPEPYVASVEDKDPSISESEIGKVYPINGGISHQICNPSISQDTDRFPASMLWLNFGGDLGVKSSDSEYTVVRDKVTQHDRLTISDTSNRVLWFLMRDTANGDCQFQDPEWSTHPNYIAALRAYDINGSKACDPSDLDYGNVQRIEPLYDFFARMPEPVVFPARDEGVRGIDCVQERYAAGCFRTVVPEF